MQDSSNALGLSSSSQTAVTLTAYGSSVSWVRMGFGTKNKCLSAQWGDTGDDNAVMYACQVGAGGSTTSGSTLEPTKQWWILVPTDGSSDSSWGSSQLSKLKTAQAQSVSVRNAANSKFRRALEELDDEIEGREEEMSVEDRVMRKWSLKKRATNKAKAAAVSVRLSLLRCTRHTGRIHSADSRPPAFFAVQEQEPEQEPVPVQVKVSLQVQVSLQGQVQVTSAL